MKKISLLMAVFLLAVITACNEIQPAETSPASTVQPAATETQDAEITTEVTDENTMTASLEDDSTASPEDGEQPAEDFGELPAASGITEEMAYEGVNNYCRSAYDWSVAEDDPSIMYVEMGEESETEFQVIFHSYTGALVYFYVDKTDGTTRMTEYVPTLNAESDAGSIQLYDYLTGKE